MSTLTEAQATAASLTAAQATLKQIGTHPTLKSQLTAAQTSNNAVVAALTPAPPVVVPQPAGIPGNWTLKFDEEWANLSQWSLATWNANGVTSSLNNIAITDGNAILTLATKTSGIQIQTAALLKGGCVT
jgi:hypothetical protein